MAYHVLVIDDEEINVFIIKELISGFKEIQQAAFFFNGWDALDHLVKAKNNTDFPDLIFVDLNMPEMDGFEFVERFEEQFHRHFPKTKIVILSNSIRAADKEKSLGYKSVRYYMKKPLDEEKLLELIGHKSKNG